GKTLLRSGNVEEAVLELKRTLTLNPRMVDARLDLVRAYIELDDSSKAFEGLDTILTENPEFADALCLKGDVLSAMGKTDQAAESYRQALKINPSFSGAQSNLERLLSKEKISS
ncbi:MAG: tetratricopeptide repeat protein, partial [bacterium]